MKTKPDTLAKKADELAEYLNQMGLKVYLLNRLKSIHGPEDDIMEFDLNMTCNLRLLADDDNPGSFILLNVQRLDKGDLPGGVWDNLNDLGITVKN